MTKRGQKQLVGLVLVLLAALFYWVEPKFGWFQSVEQGQPGLYTVVDFSDGDTIAVDMNGTRETIRLIGVDTPETHHPNLPVQCFGPEASSFTKQLISNQKVRLAADPTNQNRDRYNRLLRYVYLSDGRLVQNEIIKNGYGFSYTQFPFTKTAEFEALEDEAKAHNRGLWGNCTVTTESNGREQTNPAQ